MESYHKSLYSTYLSLLSTLFGESVLSRVTNNTVSDPVMWINKLMAYGLQLPLIGSNLNLNTIVPMLVKASRISLFCITLK